MNHAEKTQRFNEYLKLVDYLVGRTFNRAESIGLEKEELQQAGRVGLWEALDRVDWEQPKKSVTSFLWAYINRSLFGALRFHGHPVSLPTGRGGSVRRVPSEYVEEETHQPQVQRAVELQNIVDKACEGATVRQRLGVQCAVYKHSGQTEKVRELAEAQGFSRQWADILSKEGRERIQEVASWV